MSESCPSCSVENAGFRVRCIRCGYDLLWHEAQEAARELYGASRNDKETDRLREAFIAGYKSRAYRSE